MEQKVPIIVALGGGDLKAEETLIIDREIVRLTGKRKPVALLLPTASGDSNEYVDAFNSIYGEKLGCKTRVLRLINDAPFFKEIAKEIMASDLIYVGGGNTYRMMRIWRRLGLQNILKRAATSGIVLSGLSAGGICWFEFGYSDSRKFSGRKGWKYIKVRGLGYVNLIFCPHYDLKKRKKSLAEMVSNKGGIVVACEDNAAIEIIGKKYRVLSAKSGARTYLVYKQKGSVVKEQLKPSKEFIPLKYLEGVKCRKPDVR